VGNLLLAELLVYGGLGKKWVAAALRNPLPLS
jgi:hypothetical protein